MKIEVEINDGYPDVSVLVRAPGLTADVERIISVMRMINRQFPVKREGEVYLLEIDRIMYIESVDRKTFVYTGTEAYESELKLYEMEQELFKHEFIRVSKQSILNLRKIRSLRAEVERKIRVTLVNGEQLIVSRMYADELRTRLGVK